MIIGFSSDMFLGMKNKIFKTKLHNKSLMVENAIFLLMSFLYVFFVADGESPKNINKSALGYGVIFLIAASFISLVTFKVKGKTAL